MFQNDAKYFNGGSYYNQHLLTLITLEGCAKLFHFPPFHGTPCVESLHFTQNWTLLSMIGETSRRHRISHLSNITATLLKLNHFHNNPPPIFCLEEGQNAPACHEAGWRVWCVEVCGLTTRARSSKVWALAPHKSKITLPVLVVRYWDSALHQRMNSKRNGDGSSGRPVSLPDD